MADTKVSALSQNTTPLAGDLLLTVDDPSGTPTSKKMTIGDLLLANGFSAGMVNGYISPTVASNNLTVAIKTLAGSDPSSLDPVYVRIGNSIRTITSALSVTLAAATNWFAAGSAELATQEVDYFVYLGWRTASSAVVIGVSRIPYASVYSDFSATTTHQQYGGFSTAPAATDAVVNVGRFAATLSAGAGYTWTVPTYTTSNLVSRPIYTTRELSWTPTHSRSGTNYSNLPTTQAAIWQIIYDKIYYFEVHTQNATPGGTGDQMVSAIWTSTYPSRQMFNCENGTDGYFCVAYIPASGTINITIKKYDGTTDVTASKQYMLQGSISIYDTTP